MNEKLEKDGIPIRVEVTANYTYEHVINELARGESPYDLLTAYIGTSMRYWHSEIPGYHDLAYFELLADLTDEIEKYPSVLSVMSGCKRVAASVGGRIFGIPMDNWNTWNNYTPTLVKSSYALPLFHDPQDFVDYFTEVYNGINGTLVHVPSFKTAPPYPFHRTYKEWPVLVDYDGLFMYDEDGVSLYVGSDVFEQDSHWMSVMREARFLRPSFYDAGETVMGVLGGGNWNNSFFKLWEEGKLNTITLAPEKPTIDDSSGYHVIPSGHNPEPVLIFLDWVYSRPENYDLVSLGVEGEHYMQTDSDHRVERIKSTSDNFEYVPLVGFDCQLSLARPRGVARETDFEYLAALDRLERAVVLPSHGFAFDPSPVQEQYDAVIELLETGDYTKILCGELPFSERERVLSELSEAGLYEVLNECQKQLTEYREMVGR